MADTAPHPTLDRASPLRRLRAPVSVWVLLGWTLFVWLGRIRNILGDEELAGWSMGWRLGLATSFVLGACAVGVAIAARPPLIATTARALAVFGIAVWTVRGIDIAVGDHPLAFIAVHTVLALVTIGLGLIVVRATR